MSELVSISNMDTGHLLALVTLLLFAGCVLVAWLLDGGQND